MTVFHSVLPECCLLINFFSFFFISNNYNFPKSKFPSMILSVPSRLNSSAPLFIIEILFSYSISSFCFLLPNDPIYPSSFSFKCIKSFFAFYSSIRIIFQLPITIIYIIYNLWIYYIFINKVCEVHVSSHVCLLSVMSIRQWAVHSEWLLP